MSTSKTEPRNENFGVEISVQLLCGCRVRFAQRLYGDVPMAPDEYKEAAELCLSSLLEFVEKVDKKHDEMGCSG